MSSTRSDRGFRFPLQKYSDEKALYTNFRYLQEYLNYIRKKDVYATQIIIATDTSAQDAQLRAHYITDGTNDDVQVAAAAGDLGSDGGEIVFLDGDYTLSSTVQFDTPVTLTGKGARLTFGSQVGFDFLSSSSVSIVQGFDVTRSADSDEKIFGGEEDVHVVIAHNRFHDIQCKTIFDKMGSLPRPTHVHMIGNFFQNIELRHDGSSRKIGIVGFDNNDRPVAGTIIGNYFDTVTGTGGINTTFYIGVADDDEGDIIITGNVLLDCSLAGIGTERAIASHNIEDGVMQSGTHGDVDHGSLTGLTDNDHTQYVLRSILTTAGDLPYRDGSDWQRLGIGSAEQVLAVNAGATAPEWVDIETDPLSEVLMLGGM